MFRSLLVRSSLLALLLVIAAGTAIAQEFKARLSGFFEIGALNNNTGAILTAGTGKLNLDVGQNSATSTLTYSGFGSNVTQAHIFSASCMSQAGSSPSSAQISETTQPGHRPVRRPGEP